MPLYQAPKPKVLQEIVLDEIFLNETVKDTPQFLQEIKEPKHESNTVRLEVHTAAHWTPPIARA